MFLLITKMWGKNNKKENTFTKKNWTQARKIYENKTETKNVFLYSVT